MTLAGVMLLASTMFGVPMPVLSKMTLSDWKYLSATPALSQLASALTFQRLLTLPFQTRLALAPLKVTWMRLGLL